MPLAEFAQSDFTIDDEEIDSLQHLLLEHERPLSTEQLALALLEARFQAEEERARAIYQDCLIYDPTHDYEIGARLLFTAENQIVGEVVGKRAGHNQELGEFCVLQLDFADGERREYAAALAKPHALSQNATPALFEDGFKKRAADQLAESGESILPALTARLHANGQLVQGGDHWFPRDLLVKIGAGQLQLIEAVLQLQGGGPLTIQELLLRTGDGINVDDHLLSFSLNIALRADARFTEVGPAGQILWFLTSELPEEANKTNPFLRYEPDPSNELSDWSELPKEMSACLRELDDEWSEQHRPANPQSTFTITLTYPHRRAGTLPLNSRLSHFFPRSRIARCIWMTFIDSKDGEIHQGWVFPEGRYVSGLAPWYRKHRVPIGAYISLYKTDEPTRIRIDYIAYNERSENVRIAEPKQNRLRFSEQRRPISVAYDDLMIFGVADLPGLDTVAAATQSLPLPQLLRDLGGALSALTPQGALHFKTLYSAVNLLRRLPPAPLCAALLQSADFRSVGGNYWTLTR